MNNVIMEDEKEPLNLTVRANFKKRAAQLAKLRLRSISGLFEDLVDEEEARISVVNVPTTGNKPLDPHASRTRKNPPTRIRNKADQSMNDSLRFTFR